LLLVVVLLVLVLVVVLVVVVVVGGVVVVVDVDFLSLQLFLCVLEGHQPKQLRCTLEHSSCSHQVHTFFAFQACKAGTTEFLAFGTPMGGSK
jgi:hypothetical protein